ncbi:MAG: hypothetical protein DYG92_01200 [Leptolyngbya sp. PLA1]|nr:hypothetical protein [Leptolyngbya sp. PLA1]
MAAETDNTLAGSAAPGRPKSLRELWQVPALVAGVLVLGSAVVTAVMTAPAPDLTSDLERAAKAVERADYAGALATLNKSVLPHVAQGHLGREQLGEFHLLRARSLFLGQQEAGLDRRVNHENILKEYASAERMNAALGADDHYYLARTRLSLGELREAVLEVEKFPAEAGVRRVEVLRGVTEAALASRPPNHAMAMDLINRINAESGVSVDDRVWALSKQADVLIAGGYSADAVSRIVRTIPRLEGAGRELMGELLVMLGRAYLAEASATHDPAVAADCLYEAGRQLTRASELIGADHAQSWLVTLLRAEISHHQGELEPARRGYRAVLDDYGFSDGRAAALLGLAEVEAQRNLEGGDVPPEEALGLYEQLVDAVAARGPSAQRLDQAETEFAISSGEVTPARAGTSLLSRFKEQFELGNHGLAQRYAALAERVWGEEQSPAELMLGLAEVHKRLAEELLASAGAGGLMGLAEADAGTQREARAHLMEAGEYYKRHAEKVVLTDAEGYSRSIWDSADAFDRAGDLQASTAAFQQFVSDFPGDPRHAEAVFRLAQASMAAGDVDRAAGLFQELIDSRGSATGAGEFADQSFVPLARALLLDADPANDARAESFLVRVVDGEVAGPSSPVFREGLRELADHLHRTGRFAGAIQRYTQYLELLGDRDTVVEYKLAESCRGLAAEIERALRTGMPEGTKRDLSVQRDGHLERAQSLYAGARAALASKKSRSTLENLYLRNATFYEADCAFDLGDFAGAARLYDGARERYSKEPAALVAMTQIVSCLLAQGETAKAQIAQQRAKRFYESLPESVWDDPTLPMGREGWQRWLDAQAALTSAGGGGRE